MARVLWHGDAGCHTGFARVTHAIGERLVRDYGHEIHVLAINHRGDDFPSTLGEGKTPLWLYRPTTLIGHDMYGNSRVLEMLAKVNPDVVVEYNDPHIILSLLFDNQYDPDQILRQARPIISYLPCDGTNLPERWKDLAAITNVVAMSRYGQEHYEGSKLVYHGIDRDHFWPVHEKPVVTSKGDVCKTKRECRIALGFDPDIFLVLRVDKNSGRKDFGATFSALVPFMKRHDDVRVHLHTQVREHSSGVDLQVLMGREPDLSDRWFFPSLTDSWIGWEQADLNVLYNAADVFISTSRGEGFGLTLAEALSCGVPVIAQDVSAITEVVGPGGVLLKPQRLITVPSGEDVWLADIEAFTDALEQLYGDRDRRIELGKAGVRHVRANFDWDTAAQRFDHYITALAAG